MILQIFVVFSSFLSLSYGFIAVAEAEIEYWKTGEVLSLKDKAVEFVWNALTIGPRVVALGLLAGLEPTMFTALLVMQCVVIPVGYGVYACKCADVEPDAKEQWAIIKRVLAIAFCGVMTLFNVFRYWSFVPQVYIPYWVIMCLENVWIMVAWYKRTSEEGLWYHDVAISFVISAYTIALIIRLTQICMIKRNKEDSV